VLVDRIPSDLNPPSTHPDDLTVYDRKPRSYCVSQTVFDLSSNSQAHAKAFLVEFALSNSDICWLNIEIGDPHQLEIKHGLLDRRPVRGVKQLASVIDAFSDLFHRIGRLAIDLGFSEIEQERRADDSHFYDPKFVVKPNQLGNVENPNFGNILLL